MERDGNELFEVIDAGVVVEDTTYGRFIRCSPLELVPLGEAVPLARQTTLK